VAEHRRPPGRAPPAGRVATEARLAAAETALAAADADAARRLLAVELFRARLKQAPHQNLNSNHTNGSQISIPTSMTAPCCLSAPPYPQPFIP